MLRKKSQKIFSVTSALFILLVCLGCGNIDANTPGPEIDGTVTGEQQTEESGEITVTADTETVKKNKSDIVYAADFLGLTFAELLEIKGYEYETSDIYLNCRNISFPGSESIFYLERLGDGISGKEKVVGIIMFRGSEYWPISEELSGSPTMAYLLEEDHDNFTFQEEINDEECVKITGTNQEISLEISWWYDIMNPDWKTIEAEVIQILYQTTELQPLKQDESLLVVADTANPGYPSVVYDDLEREYSYEGTNMFGGIVYSLDGELFCLEDHGFGWFRLTTGDNVIFLWGQPSPESAESYLPSQATGNQNQEAEFVPKTKEGIEMYQGMTVYANSSEGYIWIGTVKMPYDGITRIEWHSVAKSSNGEDYEIIPMEKPGSQEGMDGRYYYGSGIDYINADTWILPSAYLSPY